MTPSSDINRLGNRLVSGAARPEKGFFMFGSRRHTAGRENAPVQDGAVPEDRAVPDRGVLDRGAPADRRAPEDTALRGEPVSRVLREDADSIVEVPASPRKRSAAIERFERRAEEIARAAEVGVRAMVEKEAELFRRSAPSFEERLPEVRDERSFAGRDPRQHARREGAHARVEQRPSFVDAEGRDAIPFGLKRRVMIRVPIFRDEERRRAPRFPVAGDEGGEVGLEGGVGVDDQEVADSEKRRRVAERPGGSEQPGLAEEGELRQLRCLVAQVALHLVAEVMQINRYFADAGLVKSPEMHKGHGDV
jgi:hypothetical protein